MEKHEILLCWILSIIALTLAIELPIYLAIKIAELIK